MTEILLKIFKKKNKKPLIAGVDPGATGGVCFYDLENERVVHVASMPDPEGFIQIFRQYKKQLEIVFMERQWAHSKQGLVSAFTLGTHYGILQGILTTLKIPYVTVAPQSWQCHFFGKNGLKGRKFVKKLSLEKAKELHPEAEIKHDGHSDAVLIAEFGKILLSDEKLMKKYLNNDRKNSNGRKSRKNPKKQKSKKAKVKTGKQTKKET